MHDNIFETRVLYYSNTGESCKISMYLSKWTIKNSVNSKYNIYIYRLYSVFFVFVYYILCALSAYLFSIALNRH